tara:strand:- start:158 stop:295 length:138 start_codon:yes stop_codon:yes gene_type:complete
MYGTKQIAKIIFKTKEYCREVISKVEHLEHPKPEKKCEHTHDEGR